MRLALVGGREFTNYDFFRDSVLDYVDFRVDLIVSGGARGADTLAEQFADEFNIEKLIFPISKEDWAKYRNGAGPLRNKQIVDNCDGMIAFWDGHSSGTRNSITQFNHRNKKKARIVLI
jgi:hypothetical protein